MAELKKVRKGDRFGYVNTGVFCFVELVKKKGQE